MSQTHYSVRRRLDQLSANIKYHTQLTLAKRREFNVLVNAIGPLHPSQSCPAQSSLRASFALHPLGHSYFLFSSHTSRYVSGMLQFIRRRYRMLSKSESLTSNQRILSISIWLDVELFRLIYMLKPRDGVMTQMVQHLDFSTFL